MISPLSMPRRYTDVTPRSVCPSWRWIRFSGTPPRAISTACAWGSWCGAKRRRTPACTSDASQLRADSSGRPRPSPRGSLNDAEQVPDGKDSALRRPGTQLSPAPIIHADPAALTALAVPHQQGAAALVEIALGEVESFRDTQPSTPQNDDQPTQTITVDANARVAHHSNDFLNPREIRRVAQTLVAWRAPCVVAGRVAGERRRPAMSREVRRSLLLRFLGCGRSTACTMLGADRPRVQPLAAASANHPAVPHRAEGQRVTTGNSSCSADASGASRTRAAIRGAHDAP
jgi:hypothetical protein